MREIKFRAWDNYNKKIIYIEDLDSIQFMENLDFANFELMQFTGLKDKNGKDIYEGDILKSTNREDNENIIVEITYNEKMASFCIPDGSHWKRGSSRTSKTADLLYSWLEIMKFGVIGNIYENKELLNDTDLGAAE